MKQQNLNQNLNEKLKHNLKMDTKLFKNLATNLPTNILDIIVSYLTVKERIKFKSICKKWKEFIELKEQTRESLVFNIGPYPLNRKWSFTNDKTLMKIENSFEINNLQFLKHPFTSIYFKNIKKLYLQNYYTVFSDSINIPQQYINSFDNLEELEMCGFDMSNRVIFNSASLKVLVIKKSNIYDYLQLDCLNLEIFICWAKVEKIDYRSSRKSIKYLEVLDCSLNLITDTQFVKLEKLNLFNDDDSLKNNLLKNMKNLKKLYLFTDKPKSDLEKLLKQKQLYRLNNLEIIINGFPINDEIMKITHRGEFTYILNYINSKIIRNNYTKLAVDTISWDIHINYDDLFKVFKILPDNFFQLFSDINSCDFSKRKIKNYDHVFELLRQCPLLECISLNLTHIKDHKLLDTLFLNAPTIRTLIIVEENPENAVNYDYTFLSSSNFVTVRFDSSKLSTHFLAQSFRRCKYIRGFNSFPISSKSFKILDITIHFRDNSYYLMSTRIDLKLKFYDIPSCINYCKSHKKIRKYLI